MSMTRCPSQSFFLACICRLFVGILLLTALLYRPVIAQPRPLGEPVNLREINTAADEFAPVWSVADNGLYYNSTADGYSFFYLSRREDITRFTAGIRVEGTLNKRRNNQSYLAFSSAGQVYLSSFRMTPQRPYLNIFQIFRQEGGSWSEQAVVEGINEDGFSAHPAFTPSGSVLVFSSDRPDGLGGTDLWITGKQPNGLWEKPVNMGEVLNSEGNEITPFFAAEDSLYFASNGFGGKGGYEIFLTVRIAGVWQPPIPVSEINTEYDESDYIIIPNNAALFASNRPGGKGGLDLYAVFPAPRPGPPPPIVEYTISPQVQEIRIEEFSSAESFPLLPYVFFEQSSSSLPTALHLQSPGDTAGYNERDIPAETPAVYAEMLNIIGARLRQYPTATLRITGTADERTPEESAALGRRRAESVQLYLGSVWGIDKTRLPVVGRGLPAIPSNPTLPEGAAENRRVELSASDTRIVAPVRLGDVSTVITPPQIEVALDARPRRLVTHWRLTMSNESGSGFFADSGAVLPKNIIIPSDLLLPMQNRNDVAIRLVGTDSLGRTGNTERSLPVRRVTLQQKREQRIQDKLIERYSLLLFDFNQAKLNEDHRTVLQSIARAITPQARVIVSGYTDLVGEETYNAQLAEQRATAVAAELRKNAPNANIIVEAIGESDLFDNNTPYGRFYSRTVQITIEKPQQ